MATVGRQDSLSQGTRLSESNRGIEGKWGLKVQASGWFPEGGAWDKAIPGSLLRSDPRKQKREWNEGGAGSAEAHGERVISQGTGV